MKERWSDSSPRRAIEREIEVFHRRGEPPKEKRSDSSSRESYRDRGFSSSKRATKRKAESPKKATEKEVK